MLYLCTLIQISVRNGNEKSHSGMVIPDFIPFDFAGMGMGMHSRFKLRNGNGNDEKSPFRLFFLRWAKWHIFHSFSFLETIFKFQKDMAFNIRRIRDSSLFRKFEKKLAFFLPKKIGRNGDGMVILPFRNGNGNAFRIPQVGMGMGMHSENSRNGPISVD